MNFFFPKCDIFRRFCYVESESESQIGLLCQDLKKIEVKCAEKDDFDLIYYAIMDK